MKIPSKAQIIELARHTHNQLVQHVNISYHDLKGWARDNFSYLAGQTVTRLSIAPPDEITKKAIIDLNSVGPELRVKLGLPIADETQSQHWRDVVGTGHILIRGALDSLDRIARGEHQSDIENPSIGTINFGLKKGFFKNPEAYQVEGIEELAQIAKKIIAAERGGIRDVKDVISAEELQILMAGLNRFEASLDDLINRQNQDRQACKIEFEESKTYRNTRRGLWERIAHPKKYNDRLRREFQLEEKLSIPNDIEKYAEHLVKARTYYANLTQDLSKKINPYFPFDTATAKPDPETIALGSASLFSLTIGDALETAGILSKEQTDISANTQALMIAIRTKLENGNIAEDIVRQSVGQNREGKIDFFPLLFKTGEERTEIQRQLSVSDDDLADARAIVEHARLDKSNVNDGHLFSVPAMGLIHEKLHGSKIRHFTIMKNGFLLMQRGLDTVNAMRRISDGSPSSLLSGKRGFKVFPDDPNEIQEAIKTAQHVHEQEEKVEHGYLPTFCAHIDWDIEEIFDNAETFLLSAGQRRLAKLVADVKPKLLSTAFPAPKEPEPLI